ncbi:hypothetical protein [Pyrococcus abyssi]|uniref:Uncharacterized protein n=1 Tax=Pyrococcus abyssi (strain GE5 / Orsay) TaxID=272844 RepID=Q9V2R9_PYRAB|nr:hypothetical protein [Pyrococcus abyssi]CAB48929.1 Hypothetical protein PAB2350 [Pyrococcus abyssi GE5]CCE69371.1 TPA: hypothetical protein PAB2350 [Pyrococcus abyssi GE5]
MPILGHDMLRVEFEKLKIGGGRIEVSLRPTIENLRLGEMPLPSGRVKGIEVDVRYDVLYSPEVARASIKLRVFYVPRDKEKIDEILDEWEEKKVLPGELVAEVVNYTTSELMPLMMHLAKEMRIPYPVPLPRAVVKE